MGVSNAWCARLSSLDLLVEYVFSNQPLSWRRVCRGINRTKHIQTPTGDVLSSTNFPVRKALCSQQTLHVDTGFPADNTFGGLSLRHGRRGFRVSVNRRFVLFCVPFPRSSLFLCVLRCSLSFSHLRSLSFSSNFPGHFFFPFDTCPLRLLPVEVVDRSFYLLCGLKTAKPRPALESCYDRQRGGRETLPFLPRNSTSNRRLN